MCVCLTTTLGMKTRSWKAWVSLQWPSACMSTLLGSPAWLLAYSYSISLPGWLHSPYKRHIHFHNHDEKVEVVVVVVVVAAEVAVVVVAAAAAAAAVAVAVAVVVVVVVVVVVIVVVHTL